MSQDTTTDPESPDHAESFAHPEIVADAGIVKAKPTELPEPTYWPFFLALGLAFAGWGLLSNWLVSVGGLIVFVVALIGWINILRHE
jgi:hypothetical protein